MRFPLLDLRGRITLVCTLVCVCLFGYIAYAVYGDRSEPVHTTTVVVARGTTFNEATRQMEEAHVSHAWPLRLLERLHHNNGEISAGEFIFEPHMAPAAVYDQLKSMALPLAHWVTIPEGFTAAEIGERLHHDGFSHAADFAAYAAHHSIMIGGVKSRSLEGYLFPSTYLIANDADSESIAAMMVSEFRRQVPHDIQAEAAKLRMTVPEVVTLASLIEREAKRDDERALMAGVYYQRLQIGMPLEVDATLEYGFAKHHTVITAGDLAKDTPYNSYKHFGLPPTPIANPGLPSLLAALRPVHTPYLYYVYRGGGRHAFAATLKEHNQNVARYLR